MSTKRRNGWVVVALLILGAAWGYATAVRGWFPDGWVRPYLVAGEGTGTEKSAAPADESRGAQRPPQGDEASGPKEEEERLPGLWHLANRAGTQGMSLERSELEELASLPYLAGYESAPDLESVTVHDSSRAYEGLNLVVSGHAPQALLIDMDGRVLHQWSQRLDQVWPKMAETQDLKQFETFWRRAHLLPNGDLLAIYDYLGLIKIDVDSHVLWGYPGKAHHDIFVADDGTIYTLTRHFRKKPPGLDFKGPVWDDWVTHLTADGEVIDELSVLDSLADSSYASLLALAEKRPQGDLLHTNTLELLDGRFSDRHPLYRRGNILVSIPRLNTIAVIDPRQRQVVWALTGMFRFQHQPTVLDDGDILVFDNTGEGGRSKVIQIDPLSQGIDWAYRGSPGRPLSSYFLGSCQRLPNGNTLITESTAGRGLEVTPDGDVVWEYINPFRAGENDRLIASLLEVVRIDPAELSPSFLARLKQPDS